MPAADTERNMSFFQRYLTLWVLLCMVLGVALGHFLPALPRFLGRLQIDGISLPMAVLIWIMIYPMMIKVDFQSIKQAGRNGKGLLVTWVTNWLIKPFTMYGIAAFFFFHLFGAFMDPELARQYLAGAVLLGAAPCTAMVFVWSHLTKGDANFTLSQVALNDAIMIVAFAPVVGILLGLSAITVPWTTLALSVLLYIVAPVIIAQIVRRVMAKRDGHVLDRTLAVLQPVSIVSLLATLVLLFGFQGEKLLAQPLVIGLLAVPILIQVYVNSGLAYLLNRASGEQHCVAGPSALIGASNFFELAVAAAISLFGIQSGAALATVVGVLIEVPVMLSVVAIVNRTKPWYESGAAVRRVQQRDVR